MVKLLNFDLSLLVKPRYITTVLNELAVRFSQTLEKLDRSGAALWNKSSVSVWALGADQVVPNRLIMKGVVFWGGLWTGRKVFEYLAQALFESCLPRQFNGNLTRRRKNFYCLCCLNVWETRRLTKSIHLLLFVDQIDSRPNVGLDSRCEPWSVDRTGLFQCLTQFVLKIVQLWKRFSHSLC